MWRRGRIKNDPLVVCVRLTKVLLPVAVGFCKDSRGERVKETTLGSGRETKPNSDGCQQKFSYRP
jgi:hypothetical protein